MCFYVSTNIAGRSSHSITFWRRCQEFWSKWNMMYLVGVELEGVSYYFDGSAFVSEPQLWIDYCEF